MNYKEGLVELYNVKHYLPNVSIRRTPLPTFVYAALIAFATIIVIIALIIAAARFLPWRIHVCADIRGAFTRGEARVGFCWGYLGLKLYFSACKDAAGRLVLRIWRKGKPEKILKTPLPRELIAVLLKRDGRDRRDRRDRRDGRDGSDMRKKRGIFGRRRRNDEGDEHGKDDRDKKIPFPVKLLIRLLGGQVYEDKFPMEFVLNVLKSAIFRQFRLSGTLGTGDAASSAIAVGAIGAALYPLLSARMALPPEIDVAPDFSGATLNLKLECIVDLRLGKSTQE